MILMLCIIPRGECLQWWAGSGVTWCEVRGAGVLTTFPIHLSHLQAPNNIQILNSSFLTLHFPSFNF